MASWIYRLGQFVWCWTPFGFDIAIKTDMLECLEEMRDIMKENKRR